MRRFILIFFIGILAVAPCRAQDTPENVNSYLKFVHLLKLIEARYIDTVNVPQLTEKAVIAVLKELDPHSVYISEKDFAEANEQLEGSFEGIGVEFNMLNDTLFIISPISGGPSEQVGIRAGDRIVSVDGKTIAGVSMKTQDIVKLLRGGKGTKVKLGIVRKPSTEVVEFVVTRDKIPINSVDASYMVNPNVGYIKLSRFAITSMDEIRKAFADFGSTPDALILDLRGNSGGALPTAKELSDQFFSDGKLVYYTEGLHFPKREEFSSNVGLFKKGKLVVLVDEGSASASEIVAGAVQDQDRGILIGRRTFGKGLVQQQMPLGDGSFIRLTIGRYHTPSGRVIQSPYVKGKADEYYKDHLKRMNSGELFNIDSIAAFPDSLKYKTLVKGRTVYGGGGIMPDIFVPYDTTGYSSYYSKLVRTGVMNRFVLTYADANRTQLKQTYKTFEQFDKQFEVTEAMLSELVAYGESEKLEKDEKGFETSKKDIQVIVKALVARDLWGMTEYYRIVNANRDDDFAKALDVIRNWDKYKKEIGI